MVDFQTPNIFIYFRPKFFSSNAAEKKENTFYCNRWECDAQSRDCIKTSRA